MLHQEGDVALRARSGGMNMETTLRPEEEVLAEPFFVDGEGQVLVRGRDDAEVDLDFLVAPEPGMRRSSRARSSLAWVTRLMSPISSRNSVPLFRLLELPDLAAASLP